MCNIRTSITDVSVHLSHDTNMLVTVEQRIFCSIFGAVASVRMRGFIRFQTGIGEHNDQALGILITARDRHVLLGYQLGQTRRWERLGLGPCEAAIISHGKSLVERQCNGVKYVGRVRWGRSDGIAGDNLLVLFVSLPPDDGRLPMYSALADASRSDFSISSACWDEGESGEDDMSQGGWLAAVLASNSGDAQASSRQQCGRTGSLASSCWMERALEFVGRARPFLYLRDRCLHQADCSKGATKRELRCGMQTTETRGGCHRTAVSSRWRLRAVPLTHRCMYIRSMVKLLTQIDPRAEGTWNIAYRLAQKAELKPLQRSPKLGGVSWSYTSMELTCGIPDCKGCPGRASTVRFRAYARCVMFTGGATYSTRTSAEREHLQSICSVQIYYSTKMSC
nr:hypothetical protein CFP56_38831 [Quercus suber]